MFVVSFLLLVLVIGVVWFVLFSVGFGLGLDVLVLYRRWILFVVVDGCGYFDGLKWYSLGLVYVGLCCFRIVVFWVFFWGSVWVGSWLLVMVCGLVGVVWDWSLVWLWLVWCVLWWIVVWCRWFCVCVVGSWWFGYCVGLCKVFWYYVKFFVAVVLCWGGGVGWCGVLVFWLVVVSYLVRLVRCCLWYWLFGCCGCRNNVGWFRLKFGCSVCCSCYGNCSWLVSVG